nr:hypothetical protein BdHM001_24180 [Bdellovibrio sp. HM001]
MELADLLHVEFKRRQNKNPRYSLRAFAKSLDQDAGTLTRVMSGKRLVKQATALSVMTALNLDQETQTQVLELLSKKRTQRKPRTSSMQNIDTEVFENIFEKTNILILASLRLNKFRQKRNWKYLAHQLALPEEELQLRIGRLERIGAVSINETAVEVLAKNISTLPIPFTTEKRKTVQQEFLEDAKKAIDEVPFELRDNCTLTVPISSKDLLKIKQILQKARHRINVISEKKSNHEHIYNISMAVYPAVL